MNTWQPKGTCASIGGFELGTFRAGDASHPVYRKGSGPAVIVIAEMPGLSPKVLGFADRVAAYGMQSMLSGCVSRDFSTFALDRTSPIASWLRALARAEHQRCGGAGVGVVGMCFSGGFGLAMATDPAVVAPVMSQPSLPLPVGKARKSAIDVSEADLDTIAGRCSAEGLRILGLRFDGDPLVPRERFAYLKERLGDGFIAVELDQVDANPDGLDSPLVSTHHSVLTTALIDEPGQPTRAALDQVLDFFRSRLLED